MRKESFQMLIVNPGSTSTKLAVFNDEEKAAMSVIRHKPEEFAECKSLMDQKKIRMKYVREILEENNIQPHQLDAVVGRGGLIKPIPSGTYIVNEKMTRDLSSGFASRHASSLGGLIAYDIGREFSIPAYVVDPVVVDELAPAARISGIPQIERRSVFHALNAKAAARRCASEIGVNYEDGRFIVAHMGGGISVGAHKNGRVIDVNDGLYGEGPFSPERSGALPCEQVIQMCFSGNYSKEDMIALVTKRGGLMAYIGTNDMRTVGDRINDGDDRARQIVDAMAYQVSKEIGAQAAVLEFQIDAVILTGGLAYFKYFVDEIIKRVCKIAAVKIYPGEEELLALAKGALRVLRGQETAAIY